MAAEVDKGWSFQERHPEGVIVYSRSFGIERRTEIPVSDSKTIVVDNTRHEFGSATTIFQRGKDCPEEVILAHATSNGFPSHEVTIKGRVIGKIHGSDIGLALARAIIPKSFARFADKEHVLVESRVLHELQNPIL